MYVCVCVWSIRPLISKEQGAVNNNNNTHTHGERERERATDRQTDTWNTNRRFPKLPFVVPCIRKHHLQRLLFPFLQREADMCPLLHVHTHINSARTQTHTHTHTHTHTQPRTHLIRLQWLVVTYEEDGEETYQQSSCLTSFQSIDPLFQRVSSLSCDPFPHQQERVSTVCVYVCVYVCVCMCVCVFVCVCVWVCVCVVWTNEYRDVETRLVVIKNHSINAHHTHISYKHTTIHHTPPYTYHFHRGKTRNLALFEKMHTMHNKQSITHHTRGTKRTQTQFSLITALA